MTNWIKKKRQIIDSDSDDQVLKRGTSTRGIPRGVPLANEDQPKDQPKDLSKKVFVSDMGQEPDQKDEEIEEPVLKRRKIVVSDSE